LFAYRPETISHAAVAAQFLSEEHVTRFLAGRELDAREQAFHALVSASHSHNERARKVTVESAASVLVAEEVYHATAVISLFNFYNTFVDLNGVAELTTEGYTASGVRLATHGYAPPPR
jgi:hypothetical protein